VAVAVGMSIATVPVAAAPAHADVADDAFFAALNARGVCPQIKHGGKSLAWTISGMVMSGIPRQIATTMAGEAVKAYCPEMIRSVLP